MHDVKARYKAHLKGYFHVENLKKPKIITMVLSEASNFVHVDMHADFIAANESLPKQGEAKTEKAQQL